MASLFNRPVSTPKGDDVHLIRRTLRPAGPRHQLLVSRHHGRRQPPARRVDRPWYLELIAAVDQQPRASSADANTHGRVPAGRGRRQVRHRGDVCQRATACPLQSLDDRRCAWPSLWRFGRPRDDDVPHMPVVADVRLQ